MTNPKPQTSLETSIRFSEKWTCRIPDFELDTRKLINWGCNESGGKGEKEAVKAGRYKLKPEFDLGVAHTNVKMKCNLKYTWRPAIKLDEKFQFIGDQHNWEVTARSSQSLWTCQLGYWEPWGSRRLCRREGSRGASLSSSASYQTLALCHARGYHPRSHAHWALHRHTPQSQL